MKKLKAVVVGFGNRGEIYAEYALEDPEHLEIVAVVDKLQHRLEHAKKVHSLRDDQLFTSLDEFLSKNIEADVVINGTMDQDHYKTCMAILNHGYNMLCEKPIVNNKNDLLDIKKAAEEHGCLVFVCHVLRYTPFYRTIKQKLLDGEIGKVLSMEMNEHVALAHYIDSYDRGKWNDEKVCGSTFLLAKCCHDLDMITWLNNSTKPANICSFGGRHLFTEENAPEGHTEFCYQCPHYETCLMSSKRQNLEMDPMPFLTWARLNKPVEEITMEEKIEFLKHDIYGKCAYTCAKNLVDRQNLIIQFEDGSVCNFMLVAGAAKADRYIHIVGSLGEIEGKIEENKIVVRKTYKGEETIDLNKQIIIKVKDGGHSGGDYMIMHDLVNYLNGDKSSISITSLEDSVLGHLCVYAADESRKSGKIINLKEFIK